MNRNRYIIIIGIIVLAVAFAGCGNKTANSGFPAGDGKPGFDDHTLSKGDGKNGAYDHSSSESKGQSGTDKSGADRTNQADIRRIHNGYGTVFVSGRSVVNKVDTTDSTVVDWRREPVARASRTFMMNEIDGIVYKTGQITDGRDKGSAIQLHLNLKMPAKTSGGKSPADTWKAYDPGAKSSVDTGKAYDHDSKSPADTGKVYGPDGKSPVDTWKDYDHETKLTDGHSSGSAGGFPVILFVPGGGFISCDIDKKYRNVHRYLVEHGYAVAVMEYHVIGQGTFVDALEDVKDAVDWLKKYGSYYGLKSDSVYLIGNSGGGYLASMAACQDPSNIKCVVNFYGLCDIANNKADYGEITVKAHHKPNSTDSQFVYGVYSGKALGTDAISDAKASPVSYVNGDEPPFIHFHGDKDLWVSPSQSLHLHKALLNKDETSERYILHGEGHGSRGFRTYKALDTAIGFMSRY